MLVNREEAKANATKVRLLAESEANKYKLTKEFVQLEAIRAASNNTKAFLEMRDSVDLLRALDTEVHVRGREFAGVPRVDRGETPAVIELTLAYMKLINLLN